MIHEPNLRIGIDIGGTFTDFVIFDPVTTQIRTFKILSTPDDPSLAVLKGLERLKIPTYDNQEDIKILHGSTVATNALLERKGAITGLITTLGFADIIQIGRQNRPSLYELNQKPPEPLVTRNRRFEINERVASNGEVLRAINLSEIKNLLPSLQELEIESVAICLLFSFLHPEHEMQIAKTIREAGYFVSASCEILPEFREYERSSTTVINAYVSPVLDRYLTNIENNLPNLINNVNIQIMQSNGGVISLQEAKKNGIRCILSGPAGGVVGSHFVAAAAFGSSDPVQLLTFDMGGTSTDVSLIDNAPILTTESNIGGLPIGIPVLDIHTIGSGGGSIAKLDPGGALRVGPESAGADPGPACYARIDPEKEPEKLFPTVTDANLVLGRILPDRFLGGTMPLRLDYAQTAIKKLGDEMGFSMLDTALGIIKVANTHMERALRVISVERGYDPRDFTLLSFGGAGSLHAADLARQLTIPRVLVPPYASTLSALGMLAADVVKDFSQTVMLPGSSRMTEINTYFQPLKSAALTEMYDEQIPQDKILLETYLDMRYRGQSYEISVLLTPGKDPIHEFHQAHAKAYGYFREDVPADNIEIVNIRLRAIGKVSRPIMPRIASEQMNSTSAFLDTRFVILESGESQEIPFYAGESLPAGYEFRGPAVIIRPDTTIFIGKQDRISVDSFQNIFINVV